MDAHTDPRVTSAQPMPVPPVSGRSEADVRENKDVAALGYAWVLSVFVLLAKKDSPFVQFHARQGAVLFALSVVFWFVPVVGRVLELAVLALCSFGFLAAAQGEWKVLPIVGAMANGEWGAVRAQWKELLAAVLRGVKVLFGLVHKKRHDAARANDAAEHPSAPGNDASSAARDGRSSVSSDSSDSSESSGPSPSSPIL